MAVCTCKRDSQKHWQWLKRASLSSFQYPRSARRSDPAGSSGCSFSAVRSWVRPAVSTGPANSPVNIFKRTCNLTAARLVATRPPKPAHSVAKLSGSITMLLSGRYTPPKRCSRGMATGLACTTSAVTRCNRAYMKWHACSVKRCSSPWGVIRRPVATAVCANSSSVASGSANQPNTNERAKVDPVTLRRRWMKPVFTANASASLPNRRTKI